MSEFQVNSESYTISIIKEMNSFLLIQLFQLDGELVKHKLIMPHISVGVDYQFLSKGNAFSFYNVIHRAQ